MTGDQIERLMSFLSSSERQEFETLLLTKVKAASEGSFNFIGSSQRPCADRADRKPHLPHWNGGGYNTVRYGYVSRYCAGLAGVDEEERQIVFTSRQVGDAGSLSHHEGYWKRVRQSDEA